jgi:multicomponent Na+:H+ antiporter subunit F
VTEFLFAAAGFIVAITAAGLLQILRGPTAVDRMMATQLLGAGGVAALLLAEIRGSRGAIDVALVLSLLASISGVAFVIAPFRNDHSDNTRDRSEDDARD